MSVIFTLKGRSSTLSIDFNIPLELDPNHQYGLALIGFYSYNTIPNISENYFYYHEEGGETKKIHIPTGTYEISDIADYLERFLLPEKVITPTKSTFSLRPNNNTLKCEIYHQSHYIDFTKSNSLGKLLGFSSRVLSPGIVHESDLPVQIVQVRTIHIDCNITEGAFYNNQPSHTLYEFPLSVDPGYAIDEIPKNLIYLPVLKNKIYNLTLNILDQNFNSVNFRGEDIIVRLELKKWS